MARLKTASAQPPRHQIHSVQKAELRHRCSSVFLWFIFSRYYYVFLRSGRSPRRSVHAASPLRTILGTAQGLFTAILFSSSSPQAAGVTVPPHSSPTPFFMGLGFPPPIF